MALSRDRFEQGLTYQQYKEQMTRNREQFEKNETQFSPAAADVEAFRQLPQPLNVAVMAEDWCGDVIANLPVLGKLAQTSGRLNLRVFLRDQNLDIMDQFLKEGKFRSIPVFAFFDQDFKPVGHFIERPASVTELRARKREEIFAKNPEFGLPSAPVDQLPEDVRVRLAQAQTKMREETAPFANAEVVRELRAIVGR
jgi:hypothetical protein